jgi:transmembrane sensor
LNNTEEHIDELIGKYLAGEASVDEREQVELWVMQDPTNLRHLEHFKLIFEKASQVKETHVFDEDAAWNKMKAKLKAEPKVIPMARPNSGINFFYRIAASIVVILGVGFFVYKAFDNSDINQIEVVADARAVSNVLPDGSGVFLNKKTKLTYTFDKKQKAHIVKLKGEAYFEIKHEEEKNLIIDIAGVYIKDIGTAFNVKAYPDSNTIEVFVEEGEIVFYTDKDSGVHLHASAKGIYDKTTKSFSIANPEENVLAYKTKMFSFDGSMLSEVVRDLNNVYEKKIILPEHLKQCRLTVDFANEDIDEIANVIAETLGLSVKKSDKEIFLEGARCE